MIASVIFVQSWYKWWLGILVWECVVVVVVVLVCCTGWLYGFVVLVGSLSQPTPPMRTQD